MQYVRSILDALSSLPVSTVFVCGRGVRQADEFATHLAPIAGSFQLDDGATRTRGMPPYASGLRRFVDFREALARHRPDHAYVPYADGLMQVAGLARQLGWRLSRPGMEIEGLMMRGRFAYDSGPLAIRDRATIKTLHWSPFDIVHHLDPIAYDFLVAHSPRLTGRLRLLPEAVERVEVVDRVFARVRLNIPAVGRYVGCLGALSAAKGVGLLLRVFLHSPPAPDVRLLLIGKADPQLRDLLNGECAGLRESGRIIHIDRYVSQEELHLGLNALDVICVPYLRQIGSSGILVRAAAAGRPVLGTEFGWIGRVIRDFELGETCDIETIPAFAAALERALGGARTYRAGSKAQNFKAFHSIENFEAHWTRRLRQRLRLRDSRELLQWKWPNAH